MIRSKLCVLEIFLSRNFDFWLINLIFIDQKWILVKISFFEPFDDFECEANFCPRKIACPRVDAQKF